MTGFATLDLRARPRDRDLAELLESRELGVPLLVLLDGAQPSATLVEQTLQGLTAPLAATGSPLPIPVAGAAGESYPLHAALPPAPTLASPSSLWFVVSGVALDSLVSASRRAHPHVSLDGLCAEFLRRGWRHVAIPGVAAPWEVVGTPEPGLEAHVLWATTRMRPLSVLLDGACLVDEAHSGTHQLIIEIARGLAAERPETVIRLAVPDPNASWLTTALAGSGVEAVERRSGIVSDVVYRPYQVINSTEVEWLWAAAPRVVVGQLDMIGFSNRSYFPSDELFHLSRNLQRATMRAADIVVFISEFSLHSSVAECADLDVRRLFVSRCGADPQPASVRVRPESLDPTADRFVLCLSATLWHKNRTHAIATFAELIARHGYTGRLVIAGAEPFYGSSTEADDALLDELGDEVRSRVVRLGRVGEAEKWWLLERADAVLYPSVVEGFGLVPFEAAAVGTPCLSFAGTAQAEVLAGTGAIIDSWDPMRWAERVSRWLSDDSLAISVVTEVGNRLPELSWAASASSTWHAIDTGLALPSVRRRVEEGGWLSSVAGPAHRRRRFAVGRFHVVRVVPGLRRRWRALRRAVWPGRSE